MNNTTTNGTVPTAMARHEPEQRALIEPQNMSELATFAEAAAKSGFFGAKNKEQALMIAMAGRDLGLSYTQALRMFHVIDPGPDKQGNPRPPKLVISADGMVAVCLSKPHVCEYFRVLESDEKHAVVETKRVGDPAKQYRFTVEEARAADLVKDYGNWKKWPARMCLARAKAFLARDVYPDLLAGLYDPDEIRDSIEEPRRVEAVPVAPSSSPTVTPEISPAAYAFADVCSKAQSLDELKETGRAIADANLSDVDRAHVKAAYDARRKALKVPT